MALVVEAQWTGHDLSYRLMDIRGLWMIGLNAKVGEQKGLAAGMHATAVRLNGDKDGVNLSQRLGVI
jgi:hypothetical protein